MKRESSKTFRVLFVCTGNSCRSPMAEGLLKYKIPDELKDDVIVRSAGTLGLEGNRATPFAIITANKFGANISNHRSAGLSPQLVDDSDIIFALDESHKTHLLKQFPEAGERIFLLKEFARKRKKLTRRSIADPIGGSMKIYESTCKEINNEVERTLPQLLKMIQQKIQNGD